MRKMTKIGNKCVNKPYITNITTFTVSIYNSRQSVFYNLLKELTTNQV
jgi:hypothetical protein